MAQRLTGRTMIADTMACVIVASLVLFACASTGFAAGAFSVTDLRCEDLVDPLGVDVAKPRLSWRMASGKSQS